MTLTIKALWTAGIVDTLLGLIFAFTSDEFICAYVGIAMISLLYAAFLNILLLPMRSRLLVRLHTLSGQTAAAAAADTDTNAKN